MRKLCRQPFPAKVVPHITQMTTMGNNFPEDHALKTYKKNHAPLNWELGSAVARWLIPRTPDPDVGGSSPTRVKPCCVLEQGTF